MANGTDEETDRAMSPDAAFGVLGNETRMEILKALGTGDEPLSFSELRERVEVSDSGQFNYHLSKLVGHFVGRTDDGYELRRTGERIVEAVLSGAVTQTPEFEPTRVDQSCMFCEAPVEVRYERERVRLFCTECPGAYGERGASEFGLLGSLFLPPAGVQDRTVEELLRAAHVWGGMTARTAASGICPRCSATIDERVDVCEQHDADGVCEECDRRFAVHVTFRCSNCIYERSGAFGVKLTTNNDLLAFLTARGVNPITPSPRPIESVILDYDEEVLSFDPFEARFTFTVDGEALTLTVDDDLSVVEVDGGQAPGSA